MRRADITQKAFFTTVARLAEFAPDDHPLREIRVLIDEVLGRMNSLFSTLYPQTGRASKLRPHWAQMLERPNSKPNSRPEQPVSKL
jgi:hypothetical protein